MDRVVLTELNLDDCKQLGALLADDPRVVVEHADGYQALKAHLPPRERRGLTLVDASFDRAKEFERLTTKGLALARTWRQPWGLKRVVSSPQGSPGFEPPRSRRQVVSLRGSGCWW
jgi:23S rRNA (adenine2030-N6)-methyltransferase